MTASRPQGAAVVDCAGAQMGGALRLLTELDAYLERRPAAAVRVVGRDRQVTATWLALREARRTRLRAVALNNVSFVTTRAPRWVLLRNMLHFLSDEQARSLPGGLAARTSRAARVVRASARRADVLVVPTTAMAEQVASVLPGLRSPLVVRPHPLSRVAYDPERRLPHRLLCPVLFSPFKDMGARLRVVDAAVDAAARATGADLEVIVTATAGEAIAEGLAGSRRLRFVGRLPPALLAEYQSTSSVLIYPTRIESFGYPLAEARLAGMPVVAADTSRTREVAGPALCSFQDRDSDSIAAAVLAALKADVPLDQDNPFDPDRYFDWLLGPGGDR